MGGPVLTRKDFLVRCAAGMTALAFGCGDDGGGTSAGSTGDPSGSGGPSSESGTSDPTGGMTSSPMTSGNESESSSGSTGGRSEESSRGGGGSSSESGGTTGTESACSDAVIVAAISQNHGHALEIPLADIEAGVEKTYDASGTAGHCHEVTLTAEDFATLRAGGSVTKFSCHGGDHEDVLSCAAGAPEPGNPADDCAADPNFGSC